MLKPPINKLGFTLIELLVVIAVIGLVTTIAVTMLNAARVKARNAQRNVDIVQLKKAFELAVDNTGGALPSSGGLNDWACVSSGCYGNFIGSITANATVDSALAPYIKKPADPIDSSRQNRGYIYSSQSVGFGLKGPGAYLIWFLENESVTATVCGLGTYAWSVYNSMMCYFKFD